MPQLQSKWYLEKKEEKNKSAKKGEWLLEVKLSDVFEKKPVSDHTISKPGKLTQK